MIEFLRQSTSETVQPDGENSRRFLAALVAFLFISPVLLQLLGLFTTETYFVVSYVWFLLLSEVFAPPKPDVDWWGWARWIKILGLVVFTYIVTQRVLTLLQ